MRYLPLGYLERTQEQIDEQERKFKLYDYYGIPYGILDGGHDCSCMDMQKEIDREDARLLIMQGKEIPRDLEDKLMRYKLEDEAVGVRTRRERE